MTTHVFPWPAASGTTIRAAATIDALAEMGPVDVVCVVDRANVVGKERPGSSSAARVLVLPRPTHPRGALARVRWLVGTRRPWKLARDYTGLQQALHEWAIDYDLVWFGGPEGYVAFAGQLRAPAVCNFDDLEDVKTQRLLDLRGGRLGVAGPRSVLYRVERARWARLQREIAGRMRATVVCSEQDRSILRAPRVTVVPNVYPAPARAAGRATIGDPPTVTFVGVLSYDPNVDAAAFLVREVLPPLRDLVPSVQLRLVGRYDDRSAALAAECGVTLTGHVPSVDAELARADVIVAPIRFGGGTRMKILEAFAHRIPVVSTTIGAEGLGAIDGTHLLVADDAADFARCCARLLGPASIEERARLTEAAWTLWSENFRVEVLRDAVATTAKRAMQ